jgi:hypothetical protein
VPQLELVPDTAVFIDDKVADKPRRVDAHWVRCPEWQKLEASA